MTGDATGTIPAHQSSRRRTVVAVVAASVAVLACAALGVKLLSNANDGQDDGSAWQSLPTVPAAVVVAELPRQHSDDGYDFWVRQVQAPGLNGSQLTAAYATELTQAGWELLESYPAQDGSGFSRVCLTKREGGDPQIADVRTGSSSGSQADQVEVAVSRRAGDRSSCGDVFGQFAWPDAAKPAG
jgi:hypothetical protein